MSEVSWEVDQGDTLKWASSREPTEAVAGKVVYHQGTIQTTWRYDRYIDCREGQGGSLLPHRPHCHPATCDGRHNHQNRVGTPTNAR